MLSYVLVGGAHRMAVDEKGFPAKARIVTNDDGVSWTASGAEPRCTQCPPSHCIQSPAPTDGMALCALQARSFSEDPSGAAWRPRCACGTRRRRPAASCPCRPSASGTPKAASASALPSPTRTPASLTRLRRRARLRRAASMSGSPTSSQAAARAARAHAIPRAASSSCTRPATPSRRWWSPACATTRSSSSSASTPRPMRTLSIPQRATRSSLMRARALLRSGTMRWRARRRSWMQRPPPRSCAPRAHISTVSCAQ
jgi:hypothetical protein